MNPILFILALVVGCCFLWMAGAFSWYEGSIRAAAPFALPLALIGVCFLAAAGLGMGGVIA